MTTVWAAPGDVTVEVTVLMEVTVLIEVTVVAGEVGKPSVMMVDLVVGRRPYC